ncbi:Rrf2 family transcriptional regulator [Psychromarinibacter sp. C21-152]|uniref:Rrf2 family transcriptional regulator n=1 Tax=Psychromarinibacter sediminicola TaxID=3033385 RepID=A0AAE3NS70_9RHOB|nr:Rrf2 family transcriptional regulator [Psychromarinibacter sediminicola]MDF0600659.1 Rrf2 family transcriptional regulator [Psychromarinibacter sediminicola]
MRITKRTNLAMRVLMFCAINTDRNVTKAEIAAGCNSSENHLGHVVNRLGQLGFLKTIRGRRGGIRLARAPAEISVGDVFRNLEADVPLVECMVVEENTCPLVSACRLRGCILGAMEAFYSHLDAVTLSELVDSNDGLCRILDPRLVA